jgi:hypothetical protein
VVRIHGLAIESSVALPGLARTDVTLADVVLELVDHIPARTATRMRYRAGSAHDATSRVEIGDDPSGVTTFRYGDGTAFEVTHDRQPARIRAVIAPGQTLEDLTAYLYGPVLGFVLRSWGRLALHASCVRIGDEAILLAGPSGAGKSTTAAALAMRGVPVLSDDLTALTTDASAATFAWPAFDHVRLWPDAERVVLESGSLERITPSWDKRRFPLAGDAFADQPCPVRAIITLGARTDASHATVGPMAPAEAVVTLATMTYANYLLDARMRATELAQLGELVRAVPVLSMTLPNGRANLGALCDAITDVAATCAPIRA